MLTWGTFGDPYWQYFDFWIYDGLMLDHLGGLGEYRFNGTQVTGIGILDFLVQYGMRLGMAKATLVQRARPMARDQLFTDSMWTFVCVSQMPQKQFFVLISSS